MRMHPLDDRDTEHSPCTDCKFHKAGIDKMLCLTECERLASYRDTGSWEGIPEMYEEAVRDLKHVKKKPLKAKYEIATEEGPGEKQVNVCVMDGCRKEVYARDLCRSHYDKWAYGKAQHPVFGDYTRKNNSKHTDSPTQIRQDKAVATIKLDFSQCPALQRAIVEMSEEKMLPAAHVIMALLSEAVRKQQKEEHG